MRKIDISTEKYPDKFAIVDDDDYEYINQWKWNCNADGYAVRLISVDKKRVSLRMHRIIINNDDGFDTDHINHNKLDNRKINLRKCLRHENLMNRRSFRGSSLYKGVIWYKRYSNWQVRIAVKNKVYSLGYFKNEIDAAKAYNKAALKYHGKFAYLNKIPA